MTYREWLVVANKLAEEHPECLDMEMVTATDDEGNGYGRVVFTPQMITMEWDEGDRIVCSEEDQNAGDCDDADVVPNAVLLN